MILEPLYSTAVDIWSCGVILGELFLKVQSKDSQAKEIGLQELLFYGTHCFPLSPVQSKLDRLTGFPSTDGHILQMIFDLIGTPTELDLSFVSDK